MWHTIFRCGMRAAASASAVLLAGAIAFRLASPRTAASLAAFTVITGVAAVIAAARALWPLTRRPSDAQVARFIEEHCPGLEDRLATAVERASAGTVPQPSVLIDLLYRDAARRAAEIDLDRTIARREIARAGAVALASTLVLAGTVVLVAPALRSGAAAIFSSLAPGRFAAPVSRGNVKTPTPPAVTAIDVHYEYPPSLGMAPRSEMNGGDVYGPAGTRVHLVVHTDRPVRGGSLEVTGGAAMPLAAEGDRLMGGRLTVTGDGSYRVALTSAEGISGTGDTEYFIRMLFDAPPDIRLVQPAADREATPLEEVTIAAHADDDHGVKQFDLVYSVRGGPETAVPFERSGTAQSADGKRVLYLEDLHVRPGDFVTYYARARDLATRSRANEARSDLLFLQVTPFEQEFVPPQTSEASAQGAAAAGNQSLDDLIRAQKEIIVATWRLDRRARKSGGGSESDVKAIARAQGDLKKRAADSAGPAVSRAAVADRAPGSGTPDSARRPPDADPMISAIDAMGNAEKSLNAIDTSGALPHETRALSELLRAKASNRRWQMMQAAGAGGGRDSGNADVTTMFEQQLKREQRTNYETTRSAEKPDQQQRSDALERVRQLAERQDDLNRQQQGLSRDRDKKNPGELKRQLERLTREQSELRQQAEQLAQQMREDGGRQGQRGAQENAGARRQGGGTESAASRLADASQAMGEAASNLRSGRLKEAGARSGQAADRLRSAERQMQGGTAAATLGDLQMQAREIADAQQRVARAAAAANGGSTREPGATKPNAASQGQAGDAERRRLAGEKERLADQVERLAKGLKDAASEPGLEGRQRQAVDAVAKDLDRLQVSRQMREAASAMRTPQESGVNRQSSAESEQDLARTLARLADRLGAAAGSADTQRTAEQIGQAKDTRDRLAQLERRIRDLQGQAAKGASDTRSAASSGAQTGGGRPVGTSGRDAAANRDADLRRLQDEYARQVRRAAEQLNRFGAETGAAGLTPEGARALSPLSARGYNQDYSKWVQLSREVGAGLERAETVLAQKLREQQVRDRLQAPSADRVPEQYRRLVEQYYQSLAKK